MFNEHYGLESATLNGSKTRTSRNELDPQKKHSEWEREFIEILYDDDYMKGFGTLSFDGVNTFIIADSYNSYSFKTEYKVGEVIAIKQSYDNIFAEMEGEIYNYDQYEDYRQLAMGMKLAGNTNKMFVRNDLMPHHIQIENIKLERLQDISDEDIMKEGIVLCSLPVILARIWEITSFRGAFEYLIDRISGKGTWKQNNWNVVYYYKLID